MSGSVTESSFVGKTPFSPQEKKEVRKAKTEIVKIGEQAFKAQKSAQKNQAKWLSKPPRRNKREKRLGELSRKIETLESRLGEIPEYAKAEHATKVETAERNITQLKQEKKDLEAVQKVLDVEESVHQMIPKFGETEGLKAAAKQQIHTVSGKPAQVSGDNTFLPAVAPRAFQGVSDHTKEALASRVKLLQEEVETTEPTPLPKTGGVFSFITKFLPGGSQKKSAETVARVAAENPSLHVNEEDENRHDSSFLHQLKSFFHLDSEKENHDFNEDRASNPPSSSSAVVTPKEAIRPPKKFNQLPKVKIDGVTFRHESFAADLTVFRDVYYQDIFAETDQSQIQSKVSEAHLFYEDLNSYVSQVEAQDPKKGAKLRAALEEVLVPKKVRGTRGRSVKAADLLDPRKRKSVIKKLRPKPYADFLHRNATAELIRTGLPVTSSNKDQVRRIENAFVSSEDLKGTGGVLAATPAIQAMRGCIRQDLKRLYQEGLSQDLEELKSKRPVVSSDLTVEQIQEKRKGKAFDVYQNLLTLEKGLQELKDSQSDRFIESSLSASEQAIVFHGVDEALNEVAALRKEMEGCLSLQGEDGEAFRQLEGKFGLESEKKRRALFIKLVDADQATALIGGKGTLKQGMEHSIGYLQGTATAAIDVLQAKSKKAKGRDKKVLEGTVDAINQILQKGSGVGLALTDLVKATPKGTSGEQGLHDAWIQFKIDMYQG